jgi:UDP-glucose 4-epimerase
MRCVVTGGAGFIGGYIARDLLARGDEVVIYDIATPDDDLFDRATVVRGNVCDWSRTLSVVEGADEVYHCAAVLGTAELISMAQEAVSVNVGGALNVLQAAICHGVKRVFCPAKPNGWRNIYTITKFATEELYLLFREIHGIDVTVLRWYNAFGPRQHYWPVRKVVPTFVLAAITGRPLPVYGTGEQTVDLVYVEDIARVAVDATRYNWSPGVVADVGSGIPMTVNDLATLIAELGGCGSKVWHEPMRPGEPEHSMIVADPAFLQSHGVELWSVRDALARTVEAYRERVVPEEAHRVLDHYGIPRE